MFANEQDVEVVQPKKRRNTIPEFFPDILDVKRGWMTLEALALHVHHNLSPTRLPHHPHKNHTPTPPSPQKKQQKHTHTHTHPHTHAHTHPRTHTHSGCCLLCFCVACACACSLLVQTLSYVCKKESDFNRALKRFDQKTDSWMQNVRTCYCPHIPGARVACVLHVRFLYI
jgi:ABC-type Zn2+ transport system substrate-binding protein/surface adhesin